MTPRVVVTGGAGFIGSELVRQLAARGVRVSVVDNLVNGKRANLLGVPEGACELVERDVRDAAALGDVLRGAQAVYHLACLGVRHSIRRPRENHEVNATATLELLAAAREAGVPRFVYVSSSEVYGTAEWAPMNEDHPTRPNTVYGASKLAGECYARAYHRTHGYPTVIVRPFNTFGPRCHHEGDSGEVIPKFVLRALAGRPLVVFGDGSQTRDFTYVSDTARGILEAGRSDAAVGETLNLGSGREIGIGALARRVAAVVAEADAASVPPGEAAAPGRGEAGLAYEPPRPGDVLRLCAETSKARRLLGFEATLGLDEGLRRLVQWYRDSGTPVERLLEDEVVRNWESGEATRG